MNLTKSKYTGEGKKEPTQTPAPNPESNQS